MKADPDHVIYRAGFLSAPCACGNWPERPHVVGLVVYCPACCPKCPRAPAIDSAAPEKDWGDVQMVQGEQIGLF